MSRAALALLLVLAGAVSAAPRDQMRNRLYAEEARLKARLDSLENLPALEAPGLPEHPVFQLPRSWKARRVDHPDHPRIKLGKRSRVRLLGPVADAWRLVYERDTLVLPPHRKLKQGLRETWLAWQEDSLARRLETHRAGRLRELQARLIRRELEEVPGLVRLYRKQGPHQEIEPMLFLRSRALPDWESEEQRLYYSFPATLPLSAEPWGAPAAFPGGLLYYAGGRSDCLAFRDPETGGTWYLAPTELHRRLPAEQADELAFLEELLAERRQAARTYELLQRWDRDTVDRVMQGLAWRGMSRGMLLEALGEPAERRKEDSGEWWEYAAGNRVLLKGDRVEEILQERGP